MKKLVTAALACSFLGMLPARAAEVGILLDKQIGKSQALVGADAAKPSGVGFRGGVSLLDLGLAELGLTATYHPESKDDLVLAGANCGKYSTEYMAVGAQVDWKFLVNLHAGIDLRRETLRVEGSSVLNGSTTYTRPWLKAGVGFVFPTPVVKPFLRLEVAMATTKQGSLDAGSSADDIRKAMAPEHQIALYGGVRF